MKKILITGGSGYIGSSIVNLLLKETDYHIKIVDPVIHSWTKKQIGEWELHPRLEYQPCKIQELRWMHRDYEAIFHLGACHKVEESVQDPTTYYHNNLISTLAVIELAKKTGCYVVYSSSAGVYAPTDKAVTEDSEVHPIHPYGETKLWGEHMLHAAEKAHGVLSAKLRYFNAAGAEETHGYYAEKATHAIPALIRSINKQETFNINGKDYPTKDGTCVRDYLHIKDIARAHVKALDYMKNHKNSITANLGTGTGTSLEELIKVASDVTGKVVPVQYARRRSGDPPFLVANANVAKEYLDWEPLYSLEDIVRDDWEWELRRNENEL